MSYKLFKLLSLDDYKDLFVILVLCGGISYNFNGFFVDLLAVAAGFILWAVIVHNDYYQLICQIFEILLSIVVIVVTLIYNPSDNAFPIFCLTVSNIKILLDRLIYRWARNNTTVVYRYIGQYLYDNPFKKYERSEERKVRKLFRTMELRYNDLQAIYGENTALDIVIYEYKELLDRYEATKHFARHVGVSTENENK